MTVKDGKCMVRIDQLARLDTIKLDVFEVVIKLKKLL